MSAARVSFFLLVLLVGHSFSLANDDVVAQMKKFEIEKSISENGEIHFVIPTNRTQPLEADVEVKALCSDKKKRTLIGMPSQHFELVTEYFSDGQVRQYVVKLFGKELGFIKVERPDSRKEKEYTQARFEITDPSDRILGDVANAENGGAEFIVRDAANRQNIIAKGVLSNHKWLVDSRQLHPLLTAVLLCAAEAERQSCNPKVSVIDSLPSMAVTLAVTIGVGGALWLFNPAQMLYRQR